MKRIWIMPGFEDAPNDRTRFDRPEPPSPELPGSLAADKPDAPHPNVHAGMSGKDISEAQDRLVAEIVQGRPALTLYPAARHLLYEPEDDPLKLTAEDFRPEPPSPETRTFDTGATRDTDDDKLDFEGFLSPTAMERYAQYMHANRRMPGGDMRGSDNWQKGIPLSAYMKSMWRHFFAVWKAHRRGVVLTDDLCALMFNVQGMLHVALRIEAGKEVAPPGPLT
jgi:hypothetical protein